jgi:hypothetical protein
VEAKIGTAQNSGGWIASQNGHSRVQLQPVDHSICNNLGDSKRLRRQRPLETLAQKHNLRLLCADISRRQNSTG